MIKKIAIASLCLALGTSIQAKEMTSNDKFLGVEGGYGFVKSDIVGQGLTVSGESYEGSDIEYGVRLGVQGKEWRTTFILSIYDSASNRQKLTKTLFALDYFFLETDSLYTSIFKPYIGLNGGHGSYESTVTGLDPIEESGVLYGGQAGMVVNIMDSFDLDSSIRYTTGISKVDSSLSAIVAVDFKF